MGVCKGVLTSLTYDFATYKIDSFDFSVKSFCEKVLTFLSSIC